MALVAADGCVPVTVRLVCQYEAERMILSSIWVVPQDFRILSHFGTGFFYFSGKGETDETGFADRAMAY